MKKLTTLFNKVYIFLDFKFFAALQLTHIDNISEVTAIFIQ